MDSLGSTSGPFHCSHVSACTVSSRPHTHPAGAALQWTGSTCQSLTEAAMLSGHHISAVCGMRGEHRCKGRPRLAILLPLARWGAGRTLTYGSSFYPKCSEPSFRCGNSLLWCRQSCHRFLLLPRAYCTGELLSAAVPSANMTERVVNETLKAFQLRLNFSALQFKTKLSRSVSDNLVWFLRRSN